MKQDLLPIISEDTTAYFTALFLVFQVSLFFGGGWEASYIIYQLKIKLAWLWSKQIVITFSKYTCFFKNSFFYIAKRILFEDKNNIHTIWKQPGLKIAIDSKVIPLGRKTFRTCSLLSFPHLWDQIAFMGSMPDSFMCTARQIVESSISLENIWFLRVLKGG